MNENNEVNSLPNSYSKGNLDTDDENKIDDLLENIKFTRPRNAFSHYCSCEFDRLKKEGSNIPFKNLMNDLGNSWKKLKLEEKKKYYDLYEKEKKEYIKSIEIIRHYLFKDYNGIIRKPATAYQIFLNEKLIDGLNKNLDPKKIKKDASNQWNSMNKEEKKPYFDRKKSNDNWFEKAKNIKKVTPISIYIQKQISLAKEKKQELPKIKEISDKWKSLKNSEKYIYRKYADEINKEREKLQDIYELINGIKPKRPAGAFRIFLQEKAKDKIFNSIKDGKELWNRLTDDEKEKYLKKSHKLILSYKYKKMIYEKKIKRMLPKKPLKAFNIFIKEQKGKKIPNGQSTISYWRAIYENLPKNEKEKYEEKERVDKQKYEKKMEKYENAVFDMPKKPLNSFALFLKDTIPILKEKEENKNLNLSELIKKASILWENSEKEFKLKFEEKEKDDRKRYKSEMKEFQKFGYYIKNIARESNREEDMKDLNKKDEDLDEKEINTRKTQKKRTMSVNKAKRGYKRTKSQNKNNKKNSIREKSGKTQIKKK